MWLPSQEGQDLCASAAAEEHIFNTSSEHHTVHLSNKCTTKDFLRDFHGCTVLGGPEDRTYDVKLQVDVIPLMIHVRVSAERSTATKTQGNLVGPAFSKTPVDEGTRTLISSLWDMVVMQKRCLRTHWFMGCMNFVAHASNRPAYTVPTAVSAFPPCPHKCIFEHSERHTGPARARNTNLSAVSSETMLSQPILIELLAVLVLLQTHMHFPAFPLAISH